MLIVPFQGWYEEHPKFTVKFDRGLTTIIGKNGSGKTSMINELNAYLRKASIPVYHYDQLREGATIAERGIYSGNITTSATYLQSSEGEKVIVSYGNTLTPIKLFLYEHRDKEQVFLLCDGLDSGVSINIIKELREIFQLLQNDFPNVVIVNTANNYEFAKECRCIVAASGEEITFSTYEDYERFICNQE